MSSRKNISRSLRALVWNTHIGESIGRAKCKCGTTISQLSFECGHVIAVANNGSTTIDNLRPICGGCNKSMGTENLHDFFHNLRRTGHTPAKKSKPNNTRNPRTRYRQLQHEAKEHGIPANLKQQELEDRLKNLKLPKKGEKYTKPVTRTPKTKRVQNTRRVQTQNPRRVETNAPNTGYSILGLLTNLLSHLL